MIENMSKLLYEDLTYQIRGACIEVWRKLGSAFKESSYSKALALELKKRKLNIELEKRIPIMYDEVQIGTYIPDFVVEDKIFVELKVVSFLMREHKLQFWRYLKGSTYKIGLLVNFGGKRLEIIRKVYDTARRSQRESA